MLSVYFTRQMSAAVVAAVCTVGEVLHFQRVGVASSDSNFVWLSKADGSKSGEGKIGWRLYI